MVDPGEFRETFRTFKPDLDFGPLEEALAVKPPSADTEAEEKYRWVAKTINGLQIPLENSLLPYGFNIVYGALSDQISLRLEDYKCKDELAKIGVEFEGLYHLALESTVLFLKTGDKEALERVKPSWVNSFMNVNMLRQRAELREVGDTTSSRYRRLVGREATTGILAHIEEDLEESLSLSLLDPKSPYYFDFTHQVGRDISTTIDNLAPDIMPGHPVVRAVGARWLKWYIAARRENAYRNHREYLAAKTDEDRNNVRDAVGNEARIRSGVLHLAGGTAMKAVQATELLPETPRLTEHVNRWTQLKYEDQPAAA